MKEKTREKNICAQAKHPKRMHWVLMVYVVLCVYKAVNKLPIYSHPLLNSIIFNHSNRLQTLLECFRVNFVCFIYVC